MTCNELHRFINKYRVHEAILADAARELRDLLFRMQSSILRIGFEVVNLAGLPAMELEDFILE